MIKVLTIIGARPQFIKAAAVSKAFMDYDELEEIIVHTGQHFDANMSDIFFEQMKIPKPAYKLAINSLSHGAMTGRMLEEIEKIILNESPDYVMVYGDTNSTLAGALAASKLHVKVIHIEAGLRSFNMKMPEEINRILTDRISNLLFCPTDSAVENLESEGYASFSAEVVKCGDVMQDAALMFAEISDGAGLESISSLIQEPFVLCTLHRAENTDDPTKLSSLVNGLNQLHETHPVILPLHPRTRKKLSEASLNLNVHIIEPVGYLEMIHLLKKSKVVVTDSGGLQKEAYFFNKFCVTIREQTEWIELVQGNYNILVGSDGKAMKEAVEQSWNQEFVKADELYGAGQASHAIASAIISSFNK